MLSREFLYDLQKYVSEHLVDYDLAIEECFPKGITAGEVLHEKIAPTEIKSFVENNKKPSFSEVLFGYIDKTGLSDAQVYKKAGIDRRHFSKIRSNPNYHPSKNTVIALALALKLDLKEAAGLLNAAGYTLSDSELPDLIIKFCFERKIYDINDVNLALDYFSLKPLAGAVE